MRRLIALLIIGIGIATAAIAIIHSRKKENREIPARVDVPASTPRLSEDHMIVSSPLPALLVRLIVNGLEQY